MNEMFCSKIHIGLIAYHAIIQLILSAVCWEGREGEEAGGRMRLITCVCYVDITNKRDLPAAQLFGILERLGCEENPVLEVGEGIVTTLHLVVS